MSFSQSSALQSKRLQFHSEIRKKQLDDYRKRKRQQLFGLGSKKPDNQNNENSYDKQLRKIFSQQFKDKILTTPYPFNQRFNQHLVVDFEQNLQTNRYSFQSMHDVLSHLVKFAISDISNFESYREETLFALLKLLCKIMTKISGIPHNSVLRQNNYNLIEQIYQMVFYSVKTILQGMIFQQYYQKNMLQKKQFLRQTSEKIKNKTYKSSRKVDEHKLQQRINILEQDYKKFKHPLECCNSELRQLLSLFFSIYKDGQQMLKQFFSTEKQQQMLKHMDYFFILWYMMSYMNSELFTEELFSYFIQQIVQLQDFRIQMIDIFMETLTNFLLLQTLEDEQSVSSKKQQIKYETRLIQMSFGLFQSCLDQFEVASDSVTAIVKALGHCLLTRKKMTTKMIVNSKLFKLLIGILKQEHHTILQLSQQHFYEQISNQKYMEQLQKVHLKSNQKYEIYQLFGSLFNAIQVIEDVQPVKLQLSIISQLVFYQFNKLLIPQIKNPSLRLAIQSESIEQRQRIGLSVLFLLTNLLTLGPQVTQKFMEQSILSHIIGMWKYHSSLQSRIANSLSQIYCIEKTKEIGMAKRSIISIIYNIATQFTYEIKGPTNEYKHFINEKNAQFYSVQNRTEALLVLIEFKECGIIKLLLEHLKNMIYDTQSMNIDKDSVKTCLLILERLFNFIGYSQVGYLLVEKFQHPSSDPNTFKGVFSNIYQSDNIYEQQITNLALDCLNSYQFILQNIGYCEDNHYVMDNRYVKEKGFHEYEKLSYQYLHPQMQETYQHENEKDVQI